MRRTWTKKSCSRPTGLLLLEVSSPGATAASQEEPSVLERTAHRGQSTGRSCGITPAIKASLPAKRRSVVSETTAFPAISCVNWDSSVTFSCGMVSRIAEGSRTYCIPIQDSVLPPSSLVTLNGRPKLMIQRMAMPNDAAALGGGPRAPKIGSST